MKKRGEKISILVVPGAGRKNRSFKIRRSALKLFFSLAILFLLLVAFLVVAFWKVAQVALDYKDLKKENVQLVADNKKIYKIARDLASIKKYDRKIREMLAGHLDLSGVELSAMQVPVQERPRPESLPEERSDDVEKADGSPIFLTQVEDRYVGSARGMPTLLPVEGFLSQPFKRSPFLRVKSHVGIDIAAKKGSVVSAAGDGLVVFAEWTLRYGYLVIIAHDFGYFSFYGHNQTLLCHPQEIVKQGQPIALLGSSGQSSAPHLHFEIWKNSAPVDPREMLINL
ncbi:M23 family metallopeptidase [candidate division KSB1 bacterium]|nr:M23 family metallopeptidase [candidate division KSB1 bacterium]